MFCSVILRTVHSISLALGHDRRGKPHRQKLPCLGCARVNPENGFCEYLNSSTKIYDRPWADDGV